MSELLQALGIIGVTLIALACVFVAKWFLDKDEGLGLIMTVFMCVIWIICLCVIGDLVR